MKRSVLLSALALVLAASTAHAQEAAGRGPNAFGVGVQSFLRGPGGPSVTFDLGRLHIDGLLFLVDTDGGGVIGLGGDAFGIGGRAFYAIHQADAADFGLGGGLGFILADAPGDDDTIISLEFGAKIRAFVVSNVALSAFLGASIVIDDDDAGADQDGFVLGGQGFGGAVGMTGAIGITYFFN